MAKAKVKTQYGYAGSCGGKVSEEDSLPQDADEHENCS
jgi:hypothetical protein